MIKKRKQEHDLLFLNFILLMINGMIVLLGFNSNISDIFVLSLYIFFMLDIYMIKPLLIIKYITVFFSASWAVVAVLFLETMNIAIDGRVSARSGAFSTYVFGWLVFFYIIIFLEVRKKKNFRRTWREKKIIRCSNKNRNVHTLSLIVFVMILLEMVVLASIITKPYYRYNVDRFVYARTIMPSWIAGHLGFFTLFIPLACVIWKYHKCLTVGYIGLLFWINIWAGERFTGLFLIVFFMCVTFIGEFGESIELKEVILKKIRIAIIAIAMIVLSFGGLVYIQMRILGRKNISYFTERISAQGYLWWLTYLNDSAKGFHLNELTDELYPFISHLSGNMAEYNFGIYKIMKLYQVPARWHNMLDYGIRGTEATRATFYYYGKIPGLILGQVIMALCFYWILKLCIRHIKNRNAIQMVLSFYILRNYLALYSMSDFYLAVKPTMIICYLGLILLGNTSFAIKNKFPHLVLLKRHQLRTSTR